MKKQIKLAKCLFQQSKTQAQLLILATGICLSFTAIGQVSETINFDSYVSPTNNDFKNRFTEPFGATGLVQIIDSGITGGCLRVPNNSLTVSTPDIYCSKYHNHVGAVLTTSYAFKFDTTAINPLAGIQDIADIRLYAHATSNDLIDLHVYNDRTLHIYNWDGGSGNNDTATSASTPFVQYHWYKLVLTTTTIGGSFGDKVGITGAVYEIGAAGTSSPVLINTLSATRSNVGFVNDTAISIEILAAKWAGCTYIDNFSFNGYKSADSCIPTSSIPLITNDGILSDAVPTPSFNEAKINFALPQDVSQGQIIICDVTGKIILTQSVSNASKSIVINCTLFPTGIYYYTLKTGLYQFPVKKIVVVR